MSVVDLAAEAAAHAPAAFLNRFQAPREAFFTPLAAQPRFNPYWVAASSACTRLLDLPADRAERPALGAL